MIKVSGVGKRFRKKVAVDDLSFEVRPGKVTGFLGPNGSGKSTTMRLMLGLDNGRGTTAYDGKKLTAYAAPSKLVGILLEAKAFHPTRSARNHLRVLAAAGGVPRERADEVLDIVGIKDVARKGPGKFSLGMAQRLGIAAAILAKPKYLLLDEPANGLDPEGMAWLRGFIRDYAKEGNGVLVSSHLLSEIALIADNVVVIAKGKMVADTTVEKLTSGGGSEVFVRADKLAKLETALDKAGLKYAKEGKGLKISAAKPDDIGKLAHTAGVVVLELKGETATLESAFLELTEDLAEYKSQEEKGRRWFKL